MADKICFGHTWKFGSGSWFSAVQWRRFPHHTSVVCDLNHARWIGQYHLLFFFSFLKPQNKTSKRTIWMQKDTFEMNTFQNIFDRELLVPSFWLSRWCWYSMYSMDIFSFTSALLVRFSHRLSDIFHSQPFHKSPVLLSTQAKIEQSNTVAYLDIRICILKVLFKVFTIHNYKFSE